MLDLTNIRNEFPMLKKNNLVYFDNAATTFKPYKVINAVMDYYENCSVNVHRGDYDLSFQVSNQFDQAREAVAKFLNATSKEIVFTSGASSSLNLVAYGYGQKYLKEGDVILSTEAEHASNILPWFKVSEVTKAKIEYVSLNEEGILSIENFKKAMHDKVKVVTLAQVSNVLGHKVPMKEICKIAHSYGAVVVVDGAQSVPHLKMDVQDLDIDFLAFSAHKMCGPTGVGVLYGKYDLLQATDPFLLGGGSNARFDICGNILLKNAPYKFEAGTPAIEGVLGLKAAVEYLMDIGMEHIEEYEKELNQYFVEKLRPLEHVVIYNPSGTCGIVTFNVKGIFAQDVASYLSSKGFAIRAGNHCAKILIDVIQASETLRASVYFYNTKEEIDAFIQVLSEITLEKCIAVVI